MHPQKHARKRDAGRAKQQGTHLGQSESVVRGQPSGGFDFSQDLSRGLSDHFGIGDVFGAARFRRSKTAHTPVAAMVTAFSTYLIGLCILLSLSSTRELELSPWFRVIPAYENPGE